MLVSLASLPAKPNGISRAQVVMMPQVKGFTSGLSIWPRANFMNVIPACMPVVICDRGSAISEPATGAERGRAPFVGRGGARSAQLREAVQRARSGPNSNRCSSFRSFEACKRLCRGVEGVATSLTTGCDARLSPLCANQPLALPLYCPASQPVETPRTG